MFTLKSEILKLFIVTVLFTFSLESFSQKESIKKDTLSIIGTGDIMLGSNYPNTSKLPPNDGKDLFSNVKDILKGADVTFGNLEGCFLDKGGNRKPCKKGCYFFRMPDRYVNHLLDAGFNVVNIANNHMGDFGQPGRTNTVKVLKDSGLAFAGLKDICETSEFEIDGVKYGFCGFAPNSGTTKITDIAYAQKLVSELDKTCDIVIVSFHGGAEGKTHNRVNRKTETFYGENRGNVYEFAHAVIDAGADIVFGHGPHVVRAAELYNDRFIIYSMGNFCTAGDFSISGISGYAPMVKVYTDKNGAFLGGQIISALQLNKTGPVLDEDNLAAREIKRLTETDFPNTQLTIYEDGRIERKKEFAQNIDQKENNIEKELEEIVAFMEEENTFSLQSTSLSSLAESIIDFSKNYIGTPYRRGSKGPKSFDCSGFTHFVFKNFGYSLNGSCVTQINQGIKIDKNELKTGDLIFFKGRNSKSSRVGHVGIVISNEGGGNVKFIHASSKRGIRIDELSKSAYYKARYVTGLRVLEENEHT